MSRATEWPGRHISHVVTVRPAGQETNISAAITWEFWEERWTDALQNILRCIKKR